MFGWIKKIKGLFWSQKNTPQEPAVEMVQRKIIDMPFEDKGYEWSDEEEKEYLEEVRERKILRQRQIIEGQEKKLRVVENFYNVLNEELNKLEEANCLFTTSDRSEIRTDIENMMIDTAEHMFLVNYYIDEIKDKIECIKVEEIK